MNIENNAQQIPPTINGTYVQGNSNTRSVAVIVLTILLLITLFIFGAYIYFKEVYETERVSLTTNGPTTVVPSEIQPTATTTPQTMQYEVVILDMSTKLDEFDNLSNEWEKMCIRDRDQDRKNIKFSLDEWVFELGKRFFSNTVYVLHTISLVILLISLLNTTFKELILSQLWQILPNTLFPVIYFSYSIYMLFVRNWILVRNHKQSS